MLQKIKYHLNGIPRWIVKYLGKKNCLFFIWLYLILFVFFVLFAGGASGKFGFTFAYIAAFFSILMLLGLFVMLDAYWSDEIKNEDDAQLMEEDSAIYEEQSGSSVGVSNQQSAQETKTEPEINYCLEERIIQREMEIERSRPELTPEKRLLALKTLFNDEEMTLEEYKIKKDTVIVIHLDDFLTEIDWQETDSEVALRRKLRYVESLYHDNLIDTEEFESIKSEIMENMDEEE